MSTHVIQLFGLFSLQVKQEISHGTHIFGLLLITTKLSVHSDKAIQVPFIYIKIKRFNSKNSN